MFQEGAMKYSTSGYNMCSMLFVRMTDDDDNLKSYRHITSLANTTTCSNVSWDENLIYIYIGKQRYRDI